MSWPERDVSELGARQKLLVAAGQLAELGVDRSSVTYAVKRGRLHRYQRGVYALVERSVLPPLAGEQAALLVCGPRAVISHRSAGMLWSLIEPVAGLVDVTVVGSRAGRRREGIAFHGVGRLAQVDVRRHEGLWVTAPARTVVDLAADCSSRQTELALDRALSRKLTSRTAVREAIGRCPHRPGVALVRALLDPSRPVSAADSPASERLLALIRGAGLPEPEVDVPLGDPHSPVALERYRPDLMWRRFLVAVEYDGREYHSGRRAVAYDNRRDKAMIRAGWTVLRFRSEDLDGRPGWVVAQIAAALTRGGWAA